MEAIGGPIHKAEHLCQIIVDCGLVSDELGFWKPDGEVCRELVAISADQNGADAFDATGD
jgi:hypothetical protein